MRGKVLIARAAGALSRAAGRGGGTSLPGKVLLRLEPRAIAKLTARLGDVAVVSATNGKTTTAAMAAAVLEADGRRVVRNTQGANMAGGIAATLATAPRGADTGLFEVDEFWLDGLVADLRPSSILLGNLFRDQLDRYGELETIADRWAAVAAATPARLVLNADDPLVADLGRGRDALFFGIEDTSVALDEMAHASDAKHCRTCGAPYRYDAVLLGHLGHFHCDSCGATRPVPQVAADEVVLDGVRGSRFVLRTAEGRAPVALPLPGLYNVYNALAAAALCTALGVPLARTAEALQDVAPAFGRAEVVPVGGRELLLLLVKNPAGANEVLRTLVLEEGEHDLLAVLNDRIADGRDVSWVWDFDLEVLAPRVRRVVCAGTRAEELALRFKYAGVPEERIVTVPPLEEALDAALAGGSGRLVAIPTYTAMLELRRLLVERGAVSGRFA